MKSGKKHIAVAAVGLGACGILWWLGSEPQLKIPVGSVRKAQAPEARLPLRNSRTKDASRKESVGGGDPLVVDATVRALADAAAARAPRVEDVKAVWEKRTQDFVNLLRQEDFALSASRIHIWSEVPLIIAGFERGSSEPFSPHFIATMARTRRFNKLAAEILNADDEAASSKIASMLKDGAGSYLSAQNKAQEQMLVMLRAKPLSQMNQDERHNFGDLMMGHGTFPPTGVTIPLSAIGAQRGMTVLVYLAGLTGRTEMLSLITQLAAPGDAAFYKTVEDLGESVAMSHGYVPRAILADAADRILVRAADVDAGSFWKRKVVEEYLQWRQAQNFPARQAMDVYAFDVPQTPYEFHSMLPVPVAISVTPMAKLELPLDEQPFTTQSNNTDEAPAGFHHQAIEQVLNWARRLNEIRDP